MKNVENQITVGRRTGRGIIGIAALIAAGLSLEAQSLTTSSPTMPNRGLLPAATYTVGNTETINVVNGNLFLRIPIAALPSGRAGFSTGLDLIYNSQIWDSMLTYAPDYDSNTVVAQTLVPSESGGWQYGYTYQLDTEVRPQLGSWNCPPAGTDDTQWKVYRNSLISPDGSHHTLHPYGSTYSDHAGDGYYTVNLWGETNGCQQATPASGNLTFYTQDGTYIKVVVNTATHEWTAYFGDGKTASGTGSEANQLSDSNGNTVSITHTMDGLFPLTTTLADQLGHSITVSYNPNASVHTEDTITQAGYNNQTLQWSVSWGLVQPDSNLGYECAENSPQCHIFSPVRSVTSVTLPVTSQTFAFSYDEEGGWGELSQATFPSGAKVDYAYLLHDSWRIGYTMENPVVSKTLTWKEDKSQASPERVESWSYSYGNASGAAMSSTTTNPDGGVVTNHYYDPRVPSNPLAGQVFKTTQPDGSTVEKRWYRNRPYNSNTNDPGNPYVKAEIRSVAASSTPSKAAVTQYTIDKNGNQKVAVEYGFALYSNITHDSYGAPILPSSLTEVRRAESTYNLSPADAGDGSETISDSAGAYWYPTLTGPRNLRVSSTITGTGPTVSATYEYWDSSGHPNLISESHWDSQTSSNLTTHYYYDAYGNRTLVRNPRNVETHYTYDSTNCLTDMATAPNTTDLRSFTYTCENNLGLRTSEYDHERQIMRNFGYDKQGRITSSTEQGGGLERRKRITYYDDDLKITEESDLNTAGDFALDQTTWYDQLGRVWKTQDPAGSIVQTRYYTTGGSSYQVVSNPYVDGSETTMGWTRTTYDHNGRPVETAYFAGFSQPAPWGPNSTTTGSVAMYYSSDTTRSETVTDDGTVSRTNTVDGLGRLIGVAENGISATTTYAYDLMNNLTSVAQGSQTRSFSYSSMGRLTSAINPESGTISYTYDENGNVHTRTQNGKTVTYGYNWLDQMTSKTYSDSTPGATYTYDHGRRISAASGGVAQSNTDFDGLSRVETSTQTMDGVTYTFGYTYNLADGLESLTMPSGRVINTGYDSHGRPISVSGFYNGQNTSYASSVTYAAHGALSGLGMGNGLAEITTYNSRLRPTQIAAGSLLTLGYGYSSNRDNGSVRSQTITVSGGGAYTQNYTYDLVDRLATASETKNGTTTWSETFGYDNVGNRWVSAMSPSGIETFLAPVASTAFNSNNQIEANGGTYDGGNQTAYGGFQFDYDAENRQIESRQMNGAIVLNTTDYAYDADGRRVKKAVTGGSMTTYVYDAFGNLAAEYATVANADVGVRYVTVDALGSTRMVTDGSGARVECHDYLPFGVELGQSIGSRPACYTTDGVKLKFTGKERDGLGENNGLDYFGARYFSGAQGRFTTPDPPILDQHITDPQSWNLYTYARNNPLRFVDPSGNAVELLGDEEQRKKELALLQSQMSNKNAAGALYINEVKDGDKTRYFVGIQGDVGNFMKLSSAAHDLANVVQDKNVVEFGLTSRNLAQWGGAVTFEKGEAAQYGMPANQNVQVLVNPGQMDIANQRLMTPNLLGAARFEGQFQSPPWHIYDYTTGLATFHEFGHAWGFIHGQIGGQTNKSALDWENRQRELLYGPLGRYNARRIAH
jgi:RHS repeat-associated protein